MTTHWANIIRFQRGLTLYILLLTNTVRLIYRINKKQTFDKSGINKPVKAPECTVINFVCLCRMAHRNQSTFVKRWKQRLAQIANIPREFSYLALVNRLYWYYSKAIISLFFASLIIMPTKNIRKRRNRKGKEAWAPGFLVDGRRTLIDTP